MRNAKKTLSLMMVAIFTTFIVLSGIPAAAVTSAAAKTQVTKATAAVVKVEKTVKVATFNPTTAQTQLNAAVKEVAKVKSLGKTYTATYTKLVARDTAVAKKIAARKVAIANAAKAKMFTDADAAVTAAEKATNPDEVDLVADAAALATAQGAITNALELIVKLDKSSANYKGLMARVDAANGLIVKAMDDITAAEEAAKLAAEAKAKLEAAVAAAETAVKAVEAAPLKTEADLTAALALGVTAKTAVEAVTDADAAAAFAARLKVVADAGLALKAKLAADAEALKPATVLSVVAVDGVITVNFDKKPLTTVAAVDFTVTRTVTTAEAVTTPVTVGPITVVSDTAITFTVPAVAVSSTDQSIVYTVKYTTGTAVAAPAYTLAKVPAITVLSATANNLKEILVTFSGTVDADTAADVTNYTVKDVTAASNVLTVASATVQADGKSVLLALKDAVTAADDHFATNQASASVTVANVKNAIGVAMTASTTSFVAFDSAIPTVLSAVQTGPNTIKLTFSEPIKTEGTATLDSGAIYVSVPVMAAGGARTLTLTTGTTIPAGAHTLTLAGFADYSNFVSASQTVAFTAATDTTAPVVTLKSITQTGAVLQFSKAVVIGAAGALNTNFTVYTTVNNQVNYKATVGALASDNTMTVTFNAATPLPVGTATLYLNNSTDKTLGLQDGWGNLFATTTLTGAVAADVTAPTATVTSVDNSHFSVVYSKLVNVSVAPATTTYSALLASNYVVKNAAGTVVPATVAQDLVTDATGKTFTLTTAALDGGNYTVTIANVKDTAVIPNMIATTTQTVKVADVVKPTVTSAVFAGSTGAAAAGKIMIKFSEPMNTTKLADKANYVYTVNAGASYTALGTNDTVVVGVDGKSVTINLASVAFSTTATNNLIKFGTLTDVSGLTFNLFPVGGYELQANLDAVSIVSVKALTKNTVAVTLSQPVATAVAADFKFVDATGAAFATPLLGSVTSVTASTDGTKGIITFALNNNLNADGTYLAGSLPVYVETVNPTTAEKSALGTLLTPQTTHALAAALAADAIAPSVVSAVVGGAGTTITLTFTEKLAAATFAATLNGFSVAGGDSALTSVALGAGGTTVILTGTDFVAGTTTVSYNSVAGITDMATTPVALGSFSAQATE